MAAESVSFMPSEPTPAQPSPESTALPPIPEPGSPSLDTYDIGSTRVGLMQRAGFRQLVKFCIVGASSTIIDKGLLFVLTKKLLVLSQLPWVPWFSWNTLTFCLAVTNGFIWNQRWTFRAKSHATSQADSRAQYVKFLATNAVGLVLNLLMTKLFLIVFSGKVLLGQSSPNPDHLMIASICGIPFVMIWNFSAAKFWTFKAPKQ